MIKFRANKNPLMKARLKAGFSVPEVAAKLGMTRENYWRIENGERSSDPKLSVARKIAKLFKTTIDRLFKEN